MSTQLERSVELAMQLYDAAAEAERDDVLRRLMIRDRPQVVATVREYIAARLVAEAGRRDDEPVH